MRAAVLLLCLTLVVPVAQAADWLAWRKVGDATLTWGPFTVYTSQLRTPDGRYGRENQDQALIITYARDIDRDELVEATRDQWQAQGILQREPRSEAWLQMLRSLWPDVRPGSQLAFVLDDGQGQFWYRASAAQKPLFHSDRVSQKRSAPASWPSGSILARNTLSCVSS
jgi:hypothetical protein